MHRPTRRFWCFALVLWIVGGAPLFARVAQGGEETSLDPALRGLVSEDDAKMDESAALIAESTDSANALAALEALVDERLFAAADGSLFYKDAKGVVRIAATGAALTPVPDATKVIELNNSLRRAVLPLLARLRLGAHRREACRRQ